MSKETPRVGSEGDNMKKKKSLRNATLEERKVEIHKKRVYRLTKYL